jgi:hypothetical protein
MKQKNSNNYGNILPSMKMNVFIVDALARMLVVKFRNIVNLSFDTNPTVFLCVVLF